MQFELFERKARPVSTVPIVAVQSRGTMSLNAAAFAMLSSTAASGKSGPRTAKAGKQTAKTPDGADALVEFLYAKASQVIGIRLAADGSLNAYPIRKQPASETYIVTAKAFLKYHDIAVGELRRYVPELYEGGVLGFSLKESQIKEEK